MPTAAQREAFQRAVARRNAARSGGAKANTNSWATAGSTGVQDHFDAPSAAGSLKPHWHGTHSLSDLAGMAATRRPLKPTHPQPNRKVVVVGSGIAAVLLASVLAFELTGSNATTHHGRRVSAAQLFSPKSDLVAQNTAEPAPIFAPPSPQSEQTAAPTPTASALPQPQVFDPDTAPPDPPPPPALEHPGPMEPPSMGHNDEPPVGMQGPTTD
jgi:hypothetical protein